MVKEIGEQKPLVVFPTPIKDGRSFQQTVKIGDLVIITRRKMNPNKTDDWLFVEIKGTVVEKLSKSVVLFEHSKDAIPYFVIHNWEIVNGRK